MRNQVESEKIPNIWRLSIKYGQLCVKIGWVSFCTILFVPTLQKKVTFGTQKTKNDIYKNNLKKLSSVTLIPIPSYTYVPNMGILSQTMPREWSHLGRLD